ncbi:hypothetical protein EDC14_100789 [Hydrogenispora ethanolica]|uniref:DUF951 family protein n=1 Tax=Hydrogenispora ethanolica TaxID=1082276 RepID=A0A4R1RY43_HYDET|nr:hypothetical protein EDC14_100789 [Hydrogenispora ethanolica]
MKFYIGDIVRLRKVHPCGGTDWEVMRVGMDFRIKCVKCGRVVMLSRPQFEKSVKTVVKSVFPESGLTPGSEE